MKRLLFVSPAALFLAIGSCTASDDGSVTTVPVSSGSTSGTPTATGPSTAAPPSTQGPNVPAGTGGTNGGPPSTGGAGPATPPTAAICGNSVVNVGEECDDGNMTAGDGCETDCTNTPVMLPVCGNGTEEGGEQCDDGNMTPGDGCEADCTITAAATCGDGTTDPDEECDDGNMTPGDGCEANCTATPAAPECGNGMAETGEECDDGNMVGDDGCENDCTATPEPPPVICGDGMMGEGEQCDDGNTEAGDGCENDCTVTPEPMGPPSIEELAPDLDGWLITTPCGDEPSSDDCAGGGWSVNGGPSTACQGGRLEAVLDYDIGGEPGVEYDVAMHFYGVMEPRQYGNGVMREAQGGPSRDEGGTPTPFAWAEGPAPNIAAGDQNYNTYEFHVMNENGEEVRSYYFNADAGTGHYTLAINYEKTIRLVGGGSVSIRVFDNNCRMIKNCGANGGAPCTGKARSIDIAAADPQPGGALQQPGLGKADEHSGQWWLMDVVSVAFVE